jgi:hypothetical protein
MRQPRIYKIGQTSSDKVHGKLVKYRQGDCLSIDCENGKFLGALISEKFNKYYDITLIEFYKMRKPQLDDFFSGKFFGTRFGSWEDLTYAVDKRMLECKYIDNNLAVEKVGNLNLIASLEKASYSYFKTLQQLQDYYLEEIPIRIEKTRNAERFPDIAFVSKHLIDIIHIIK